MVVNTRLVNLESSYWDRGHINSIQADSSKSMKGIIKYTTGGGELEETSWFLCMLQCLK